MRYFITTENIENEPFSKVTRDKIHDRQRHGFLAIVRCTLGARRQLDLQCPQYTYLIPNLGSHTATCPVFLYAHGHSSIANDTNETKSLIHVYMHMYCKNLNGENVKMTLLLRGKR